MIDEGVHAEVLDFPGAISFGADMDEARRMLTSALVDMAETNVMHGEPLPTPDPACTDPDRSGFARRSSASTALSIIAVPGHP
jgi:predicted RNase H-like HicB family nuclease